MAAENLDRLRAALDRFARTGEIASAEVAPDFELRQASSIIDSAGTFRGPEAFRAVLGELEESFESLRFEPQRFLEAPGGEVVVRVRVLGRGVGSGIEIDNHIAWVFRFDADGAIWRLEVFEEPAEAMRSVGLSEDA